MNKKFAALAATFSLIALGSIVPVSSASAVNLPAVALANSHAFGIAPSAIARDPDTCC